MSRWPGWLRVVVVVQLMTLPAIASATPTDVVAVEADASGMENRCLDGTVPAPCPLSWMKGNASGLGDDEFALVMFVDSVNVTFVLPFQAQPTSAGLDLRNITIQHPINRGLNQSWPLLNDSRPEAVRPFVGFESRTRHLYDENGQPVEDNEWGVFVTAYPLGGGVGWCWDICQLDNQTYLKGSEDELSPFPYGIIVGDWDDELTTDYIVSREIHEAEQCWWVTEVPCDTSVVQPVTLQGASQYHNATPTVSLGFRLNETSVSIEPTEADSGRSLGASSPALRPRPSPPEPAASRKPATPPLVSLAPGPRTDGESLATDRGIGPRGSPPTWHPLSSTQDAAAPHVPLVMVVAGAASVFVALVAWLLYHRFARRDGPDQETRRRVYETVLTTPGLRAGAIASELGISHNTAKYHLGRLRHLQLVRVGERPPTRYFPLTQTRDAARIAEALAHPTTRAIHAALLEHREADHSRLAAAVRVSLPTVGRATARLVAAGLATQTRVGRRVVVRAVIPTSESQDNGTAKAVAS